MQNTFIHDRKIDRLIDRWIDRQMFVYIFIHSWIERQTDALSIYVDRSKYVPKDVGTQRSSLLNNQRRRRREGDRIEGEEMLAGKEGRRCRSGV